MRRKAKKIVYIISSITLAVVVFLSGVLFLNTDFSSRLDDLSNNDTGFGQSSGEVIGTGNGEGAGSQGSGAGNGGGSGGTGDGEGAGGNGLNGSGGSSGGSGGTGEVKPGMDTYLFRICSQNTETIYLSEENKGEYTGRGEHGFLEGATYEVDEDDINPNEYFAYALQSNNKPSHNVDVEIRAELHRLYPYYYNKIYESDAGIVQYRARTFSYAYDASTLKKLKTFSSFSKSWASQENEYYQFVKSNYLTIPKTLKSTLQKLAKQNNLQASSATILSDVANYIQNAAAYDERYNQKQYSNKDMVTCFLTEYKRGVCRHFAAAATMMFRALGIPARYTTGFVVDVEANEWLVFGDDPDEQGHAWTEVYLEDYGWIPLEVTGSLTAPPDTPDTPDTPGEEEKPDSNNKKYDVTVKTPNVQKVYDGTPLQNTDLQLSLPKGVTAEILSATQLTDVGHVENKVTIRLFDENGEDCTGKITYVYGTLTVTPKEITFQTNSKTASGLDFLQCEEYTITGLVAGDKVSIMQMVFATQEGPGVCTNTLEYQSLVIKNASGKDVTGNYVITMKFGLLILMP